MDPLLERIEKAFCRDWRRKLALGALERHAFPGALLLAKRSERMSRRDCFPWPAKHARGPGLSVEAYGHEGEPAALAAALQGLRPRYVRAWAEDACMRGALELAGFRLEAANVSAQGDLVQFWAEPDPFGGACWRLPPAELAGLGPIMAWPQEAQRAIQSELAAWGGAWEQHYSVYNLRRSWSGFALIGFDPDPAFIEKPAEMSLGWKAKNAGWERREPRATHAAGAFPKTLALLRSAGLWPCERARFLRLAAGGALARHADTTNRSAGAMPGRYARLHIPIETNLGARMTSWGLDGRPNQQHMAPGRVWYLDQRKPHAAENQGASDRIHLVLDVLISQELSASIAALEEAAISERA